MNTSSRDGDWTIALRFYSGAAHREQAQRDVGVVAGHIGRSDVRVRTRDRGSVIVAGRFDSPDSPQASSELERIKAISIGDSAPYARAYLAPPMPRDDGTGDSELDLAGAKARYGEEKAVFTLEYASYDAGGPGRYQQAAAEEARRLRREGELAFYYHGRSSSSVTIGLFPESAIDENNRFTPEVDFLQRRFKFMLRNGERIEAGDGTFWPTRLVRVPG